MDTVPAGMQRWNNVGATLLQRCVPAGVDNISKKENHDQITQKHRLTWAFAVLIATQTYAISGKQGTS